MARVQRCAVRASTLRARIRGGTRQLDFSSFTEYSWDAGVQFLLLLLLGCCELRTNQILSPPEILVRRADYKLWLYAERR